MKKLLLLSLMLGSMVFVVPAASAGDKAVSNSGDPQIRVQIGGRQRRNRWNRGDRSVTQTRIVRRGNGTFRETYRVTTFRNGRTTRQLISRVRVSR